MSSLKFYNADFSPNTLRVRAVIYELALDVEMINVDVFGGGNKSEEFLAINPNGKIPALVDGDFVLWESRAINTYLASIKPERNLYPNDIKQRAAIDQWSYWQAIHLGPAMQQVAFERVLKTKYGMGESDEKVIEGKVKDIAQFLPILEANLIDKEWIAGELSVVDFAMASTFMFRDKANISLANFPKVDAWITRLEARPSWKKAVAPVIT